MPYGLWLRVASHIYIYIYPHDFRRLYGMHNYAAQLRAERTQLMQQLNHPDKNALLHDQAAEQEILALEQETERLANAIRSLSGAPAVQQAWS